MARRKNTKRIDPRWFMDEKTETINEAWDSAGNWKSRYSDGRSKSTDVEPETDEELKYRREKEAREDERRREAGLPPKKSKYFQENQGGDDMATAEELAQTLSQSPAIMAAVEQAAQNPEVQAKADELSQQLQEDIKTDRAEFYAAAGGGIGTAGWSALMGQGLGISAAKAVPAVAALGLTATGTGLLTVAIGILIYNALQDRAGRSDTQI